MRTCSGVVNQIAEVRSLPNFADLDSTLDDFPHDGKIAWKINNRTARSLRSLHRSTSIKSVKKWAKNLPEVVLMPEYGDSVLLRVGAPKYGITIHQGGSFEIQRSQIEEVGDSSDSPVCLFLKSWL